MKSLHVQTSRSDNRRACRGFRNEEAKPKTTHRDRNSNNKPRAEITNETNEIAIIKEAGCEYNKLKKVESLLRLHAQANSSHQEIYQGLYCISLHEKRHTEAIQWGKIWIKQPSNNEQSSWKQAQLANKLKDLEALKRITQSLINIDSRKAPIALQWCIKHHLIAEEWDNASRAIKKLRKMEAYTAATKTQEALYTIETDKISQKEKTNRLNQLFIDKNKCDKKAYEIIEARTAYENGADPQTLKISASSRSVNRHGIGLERLIVPILMNGGQVEQAAEICEQLLKINPSAWKARQMHGECLLRQGKWRAGFTEQWANLINTTSIPRKAMESIYCNGTLGETMFYSRWLTYIDRGKHVTTVYAQQPLLKLLEFNFKNIEFLPLKSSQHHKKHKHLPISLLPIHLNEWETDSNTFEFTLKVEERIIGRWREILRRNSNEKLIAINWHGSALKSINKISSSDINLESFSCLTDNNVKLLSLQKGTGTKQLESCSFRSSFHDQQEVVNKESRIEQIAGIIANCDAVICDDSGPAHLASSLGKATVINARAHCSWFWQHNSRSSLRFYPNTATSFFINTWDETIARGLQKLQF